MLLTRSAAIAMALVLASRAAYCGPGCDAEFPDPTEMMSALQERALRDVPAKYHAAARAVKIVAAADIRNDSLIARATTAENGVPLIVVPPQFARIVCALTLVTYLAVRDEKGGNSTLQAASRQAAACLDKGGTMSECLTIYAGAIERGVHFQVTRMPPSDYNTVMGLAHDALVQIVLHEYAHHVLNHFARLDAREVKRAVAEFEADRFAIMAGTEAGEPPTAMHYFFYSLATLEGQTRRPVSSDQEYESAGCRVRNVDDITVAVGVLPGQLVEIANGEFEPNVPVATFRIWLDQASRERHPVIDQGPCRDRVTQRDIDEMFEERQHFIAVAIDYLDVVFSKPQNLEAAKAAELVTALVQMTDRFHYLNGVAAGLLAGVLMKSNAHLSLGAVMARAHFVLDPGAASGLIPSDHYARLLLMQAVSSLEPSSTLSLSERMDQAVSLLQEAGDYNPHLAAVWTHLMLIWFKRGDCVRASEFAQRAVATVNSNDSGSRALRSFAAKIQALAGRPRLCKAAGEVFTPSALGMADPTPAAP